MKTRNFLMSLCMIMALVFTIALVSAEANITYTALYGIRENDGSLTTTSAPVTDIYAVGYVCTSANCATTGAQFLPATNSATNQLVVTYPTVLQNSNGYVVYFYKDGYIGWEQFSNWSGNGESLGANIYLTKKASGYAPIMNLSVVNSVAPNQLISIGLNVAVDADTYSAIEDSRNSNIPLNEQVETQVDLEILDSSGNVIYTNTTSVNVPYSGFVPVSFNYAGFNNSGSYTVQVYTSVENEPKILNSITQSASSIVNVIQGNETNYNYTILNNLEMTPSHPDAGEIVRFSVDYESHNYNAGVLSPLDTRLEVEVFRDSLSLENFIVYTNDDSGTYSFNRNLSQEGSYRVVIRGEPENGGISSTQQITFVLGSGNSTDDDDDDDDEDDDNNDGEDSDDEDENNLLTLNLKSGSSDSGSNAISLTGEHRSTLKTFLWALFWLILLLITAILFILFPELWFWILVGLLIIILIIIGIVKLSWLLIAVLIALAIVIASVLAKMFL